MTDIFQVTLKAARVNAGLTQKEAAAKLGISVPKLIRWERDSKSISIEDSKRISKVYGIHTDHIFF